MSSCRFVVVSAALGVACALACSPNSGSSSSSSFGAGANSGAGSNGGAGSSSGAGASAGSGSTNGLGTGLGAAGDLFGGGLPQGAGATGSDASCAALVLKPEAIKVDEEINCTSDVPQPIAIYLMLDNSGSMSDNNKWRDAVAAITAFVQSDPTLLGKPWTCLDKDGNSVPPPPGLAPPGSGTISVAIQYFHPVNVGRNPDECSGSAHSTPAVPMAPIPANGGAITTSLGSTGPNSNTPTVGALIGGTEYCASYQLANPDKKCVNVLVTDGQPNACGLSSQCAAGDCVDPKSAGILTPITGNAFNNPTNSVITFTVGMNGVSAAGFALLNQVAIAGGSDCTPGVPDNETCNVTTGGSQGFLDALNTIRKTVQVASTTSSQNITQTTTLPCEWAIPQPTSGQTFHKELVNVTFSTGGGIQHLGNVQSRRIAPPQVAAGTTTTQYARENPQLSDTAPHRPRPTVKCPPPPAIAR